MLNEIIVVTMFFPKSLSENTILIIIIKIIVLTKLFTWYFIIGIICENYY